MKVDFSKLSKAIDEALVPAAADGAEKQMSGEEFEAYAREQIELAKAETDDAARARLLALKDQVDVVAKFQFKPGELPTVRFYKATEQKRPSMGGEQAFSHQELGGPGMGWTAKAQGSAKELAELISKFLAGGDASPAKPGEVAPNTPAPQGAAEFVWPRDLND